MTKQEARSLNNLLSLINKDTGVGDVTCFRLEIALVKLKENQVTVRPHIIDLLEAVFLESDGRTKKIACNLNFYNVN